VQRDGFQRHILCTLSLLPDVLCSQSMACVLYFTIA